MEQTIITGSVDSQIGAFDAVITGRGLARLGFPGESLQYREAWLRRWAPGARRADSGELLQTLQDQLAAYFTGTLHEFALPLDMRGTPFQMQVWEELLRIPFGEVRSYGQIAASIGRPTATRAVGAANGQNNIPIVIPCHRVIGSNGTLTGFGGGLALKQRLLEIESIPVNGGMRTQQVALPLA